MILKTKVPNKSCHPIQLDSVQFSPASPAITLELQLYQPGIELDTGIQW